MLITTLHMGKLRQGRAGHGVAALSTQHREQGAVQQEPQGHHVIPTSATMPIRHGLYSVHCRPWAAETILYMVSSECCLLCSRRDARVIFGNAESPTTNAEAGLVAFLSTARRAPCRAATAHLILVPIPIPALLGARGQAGLKAAGHRATFTEASAGKTSAQRGTACSGLPREAGAAGSPAVPSCVTTPRQLLLGGLGSEEQPSPGDARGPTGTSRLRQHQLQCVARVPALPTQHRAHSGA